jgi:hypothetical protein
VAPCCSAAAADRRVRSGVVLAGSRRCAPTCFSRTEASSPILSGSSPPAITTRPPEPSRYATARPSTRPPSRRCSGRSSPTTAPEAAAN